MVFYDVKLHVSEDRLVTILQALSGPNKLVSLERSAIAGSGERLSSEGRLSTLLQILQDGKPHSRRELIRALEKNGFTSSGLTPMLRSIAKDGRLCRFKDGSVLYNSGPQAGSQIGEDEKRLATSGGDRRSA